MTAPRHAMTGAEFKCTRESLGLTSSNLGNILNVDPRTIRAWEEEKYPIPTGIIHELHKIQIETDDQVDYYLDQFEHGPTPVLITYRTDPEYHQYHPGSKWSASWHRAVAARVAWEMPDITLVYAQPDDEHPVVKK